MKLVVFFPALFFSLQQQESESSKTSFRAEGSLMRKKPGNEKKKKGSSVRFPTLAPGHVSDIVLIRVR